MSRRGVVSVPVAPPHLLLQQRLPHMGPTLLRHFAHERSTPMDWVPPRLEHFEL